MSDPVIGNISMCLAHVPGLVRYGSKPVRTLQPGGYEQFEASLRSFDEAKDYPPHQAFFGNLRPEALWEMPRPWYQNGSRQGGNSNGPYGLMISERAFYGLLRISDPFDLVHLEEEAIPLLHSALDAEVWPRLGRWDGMGLGQLDRPTPRQAIDRDVGDGSALPVIDRDGVRLGCIGAAHEIDETLQPGVLLENLAVKASALLAVRQLFAQDGTPDEREIDFVLSCGEEAVGDRYQRGGGNIAKAIAEAAGCPNVSGADVKAFCCAPIHALVIAASLVRSGTFRNVLVVAGGSLAKLGMKFQGHLRHGMPVLEDVLASFAILVTGEDGRSPRLLLESVGKHPVHAAASQDAILQALAVEPLGRLGKKISDVAKFAMELHNPEITEPAGSGNIPHVNYRTLASLAVLQGELHEDEIEPFVRDKGMPGFSPTQGHVAASVPFLPHARDRILSGEIEDAMFIAKGSLFLGRMTNLSDGMSFLLSAS